MKNIKLHYPTDHPYWQRNKFKIEIKKGKFINCWKYSKYNGKNGEEYEISVDEEGIWVQYFTCSSGGGKSAYGNRHLLVSSAHYKKVKFVGDPLDISDDLKSDILEQ